MQSVKNRPLYPAFRQRGRATCFTFGPPSVSSPPVYRPTSPPVHCPDIERGALFSPFTVCRPRCVLCFIAPVPPCYNMLCANRPLFTCILRYHCPPPSHYRQWGSHRPVGARPSTPFVVAGAALSVPGPAGVRRCAAPLRPRFTAPPAVCLVGGRTIGFWDRCFCAPAGVGAPPPSVQGGESQSLSAAPPGSFLLGKCRKLRSAPGGAHDRHIWPLTAPFLAKSS